MAWISRGRYSFIPRACPQSGGAPCSGIRRGKACTESQKKDQIQKVRNAYCAICTRTCSYQLMSEVQSPPSFIASWLVPCLFIAATLHLAGGLRALLSEPFPVLSIRLLIRMIRIQNVELPFFVSSSGRPCRCPPCRAHASRFSVFLYWQLKWQRTFFLLFLPAVCWRWVFRAHAW